MNCLSVPFIRVSLGYYYILSIYQIQPILDKHEEASTSTVLSLHSFEGVCKTLKWLLQSG